MLKLYTKSQLYWIFSQIGKKAECDYHEQNIFCPITKLLSAGFLGNHFIVFSNFFECLLAPVKYRTCKYFLFGGVLKSYTFKFVKKTLCKSCISTLFFLFPCLMCSPKSVTENLQLIFFVYIHFTKPYYAFIYGKSLEVSTTLHSIIQPHKNFNNSVKSLCKALQVTK